MIEPSIALLRAREEQRGSDEECFRGSGGRHLRYRCCVYFSTLGPASYDLGTSKYEENIIVDCFGRERLEEYRGKHKLDVW